MTTSNDRYQGIGSNNTKIMIPQKKRFEIPLIPRDDEGFTQSFTIDQIEEYTSFFEQYGIVVIRDVLTDEQVTKSVDDIWNNCLMKETQVKRDDPITWKPDFGWPNMHHVGILGVDVATNETAFENRQNENVYTVFSQLIGRNDLHVSLDRIGIMRPTKGVECSIDGRKRNFPTYQSIASWMHWDLNPWQYSKSNSKQSVPEIDDEDPHGFFISENNETSTDYLKVQGFVALSDSKDADGGFLAVPGFNHLINEWSEANKLDKSNGDFIQVPKNDPLIQQGQNITVRKGGLVIWSSTIPHCNYPNASDQFRIVQYIKMFPACKDKKFSDKRTELVKMLLSDVPDFVPSQLGNKVFGIEPYQ
jgi:hypothetical protein